MAGAIPATDLSMFEHWVGITVLEPSQRLAGYRKYVVVRGVKLDRGPFDCISDDTGLYGMFVICPIFIGQGASSPNLPAC